MNGEKTAKTKKAKVAQVAVKPAEWVDPGWVCKAKDMVAPWDGVSPHWIEREVGRLMERIESFREHRERNYDQTDILFRDTELLVGELLYLAERFRGRQATEDQ